MNLAVYYLAEFILSFILFSWSCYQSLFNKEIIERKLYKTRIKIKHYENKCSIHKDTLQIFRKKKKKTFIEYNSLIQYVYTSKVSLKIIYSQFKKLIYVTFKHLEGN